MRPRLGAVRTGLRGVGTLRNWPAVFARVVRKEPCTELRLRDGTRLQAGPDYQLWNHFNALWLMECYLPLHDVRPGGTVVDIGANIGLFSLWAAQRAGRVVACEPSDRSYAHLLANVAASGKSASVDCLRLAVGAIEGEAVLDLEDGPTGARVVERTEDGSGERVAATTLAKLFRRSGVSRCDLLKLDCEGSEFPILLGTDDDVLATVDRIVAEVHEFLGAGRLVDLVQRLTVLGFSVRTTANGPGCWLLDATRR